jgi:probable phosphoglycerate mutase
MLVLIRHGQSTSNAEGLLLGRSDVPLTDLGRREARALRAVLGPVEQVVSSPLQRALDTAAELDLGLPVRADARWVEVDYGVHEGRPVDTVPHDVWHQWRTDPRYRPEGGETLAEVATRVAEACDELFARPGAGARLDDGDVVVVSHVSPIKAAVTWALGIDQPVATRLHLSTGSVTRVGWGARGPVLETFNEVPVRRRGA